MSPHDGHSPQSNTAPTRERRGGNTMLNTLRALYGSKSAPRIPDNWRQRLPNPVTYYSQHVAKLGPPKGTGYAVGLCPFHDDHSPSFGVKLTDERGSWCCYAGCGKGDMVAFHQRLTGLDFKAAVRELIGGDR
ncbi:MAG: CHC2 zinc finger domain-containing protein [Rhodanobacter sp.]